MNLQFYLEKLKYSSNFQNFIKENPDAFLCSGFFVIDKEGQDNKQHFDYFLPKDKKIYSFQLENKIQLVPIEPLNSKIPEEISINYDFDFNKIEKMIEERVEKEHIKNKIQKMLFSLQRFNGRDFLIGTVFVSMLGMVKINIDLKAMEITDFQKKSFFDMINVFKKKD